MIVNLDLVYVLISYADAGVMTKLYSFELWQAVFVEPPWSVTTVNNVCPWCEPDIFLYS